MNTKLTFSPLVNVRMLYLASTVGAFFRTYRFKGATSLLCAVSKSKAVRKRTNDGTLYRVLGISGYSSIGSSQCARRNRELSLLIPRVG